MTYPASHRYLSQAPLNLRTSFYHAWRGTRRQVVVGVVGVSDEGPGVRRGTRQVPTRWSYPGL